MKNISCKLAIILTFGAILLTTNCLLAQNTKDNYTSPIFGKKAKDKNYELGYKGFLESGIVFKGLKYNAVQFGGGYTSHGAYYNNIFLGLGLGIDRYDSLWFRSILVDTRFTLGSNKTITEDGSIKYKKSNAFLMFNFGKTETISSFLDHKLKGWIFNAGFGILIGRQKDVRSTLLFMYRYQDLGKSDNLLVNPESFHIRVGVEFKT